MRLANLVTVLSAALVAVALTSTTAVASNVIASSSSSASTSGSSEGGTVEVEVAVGDAPTVVMLPAGQLQSQLLSSGGIQADSPVEVYSSYSEAQQQLGALLPTTAVAANTVVFVSVLVVPSLQGNLSQLAAADRSNASEALGARTQLYYNCTSAPNIWDLLDDSNVQALVDFTELNATTPAGLFDKQNVSAVATIQLRDCSVLRNYSAEQIITGNAFFGQALSARELSFRVVTSQVVDSSTSECLVRMEMAKATLADLYPNCRIKMYTTDVESIAKAAKTTKAAKTAGPQPRDHIGTARRLGASSFKFVEDPSCFYSCGYFVEDEADECETASYETLPCTIQFYASVADCNNECGDDGLDADQCLSESDSFYFGSCGAGWLRPDYLSNCRRIISCVAISEASVSSDKSITWNLDSYGAVVDPQIVFYESGDCSDPEDPRSDCCRIACEDCSVSLTVLAMHADVDVMATSIDASMKVEGDASLTIAIYAPNGCELTSDVTPLFPDLDVSYPLFMTGISLDLSAAVSRRLSLSLQPLGGVAKFGWRSVLTAHAGALDNDMFKDMQLTNTANRELKNAALRVSTEYALLSELGAGFSVGSLGSIGINLEWETYAELNAGVSFPEPFAALSTEAYNPESLWQIGDCSYPHFMDFEGLVGVRNAVVTAPYSVAWYDGNLGTVHLDSPDPVSIISGCIATAYDAELMLVTAVDSVLQMDSSTRQKLIKILAWALGFPDIEASSIEISAISSDDGTIVLRLPVPPSIGDLYSDASDLQAEMYDRSRTYAFSSLVSTYVGVGVGGLCESGWWGPSCTDQCSHQNCNDVLCNSVDGAAFSCGSCNSGYWGDDCESTCSADHCALGSTVQCDRDTGDTLSCDACSDGYWGDDCQNTCYPSAHCTSAVCSQSSGNVESCPTCEGGYEGVTCETKSFPLVPVVVGAVVVLVVAVVVGVSVWLCRRRLSQKVIPTAPTTPGAQ